MNLTLIDRAVAWYNPTKGIARYRARAALAMAESYTGGSKTKRSMLGWVTNLIGGSADTDTIPQLPTMRERSRDLIRNSPLATGAISGTGLKVVGRGLRVQSKIDSQVLGLDDDQARQWQQTAEREFNFWCGLHTSSKECDASRYNNFAGLQALAFRSTLESGDVLSLLPRFKRGKNPYLTKVQLIEADRVSNKDNRTDGTLDNGHKLSAGVELDVHGAPVNFHILRGHPGQMPFSSKAWDVVPAYGAESGRVNVLHLMARGRPGQTRGVPFLAPVIEIFKQLDRYTEAEINAAVISGLFAVFVRTSGEGLSPLESATTGKSGDAVQKEWDGSLSSGLVVDLQPGEDVTSAGQSRPNTAFDAFVMAIMRQIGAGLNIPYEVLIKQFQSSYSASRAALLEAWLFYRQQRHWLAANFCQPVYETVIEEAVLLGRIAAPGFIEDPFIRAAYVRALWTGDGPGSIDPLREAKAARERMDINLQTLEDEVQGYDGTDYEDKIRQRGREKSLLDEAGLTQSEAQQVLEPIDDA
jgi:lambda family phage portal protein